MALPTFLVKAIAAGRSNGKFSLAGRELGALPAELWDAQLPLPEAKRHQAATDGPAWYEVSFPVVLDVSRNELRELSDALTSHPDWGSLKSLDVSHNQLTALPADLARLTQVAALNVSNNQLQALPKLPSSLVVVKLQGNLFPALDSAELQACTQLTDVDISANRITSLPAEVVMKCTRLTHLNLANNQLAGLPDAFDGLKALQTLALDYNRLASLPASLGSCTQLVELTAGFNCLVDVPSQLFGCTSLRNLVLRDNRLRELPAALCTGLALSLLDLRNNDLAGLPPLLGHMTSLRSLQLDGNGLRTIRRTLITGPVSGLLKYLRTRLPEEGAQAPTPPSPQQRGLASLRPQPAARSGNPFGLDAHALAADVAAKLTVRQAAGSDGGGPVARGCASTTALNPGWVGPGGAELVLADQGLQDLPPEVWAALPGLSKLDVSGNALAHLPDEALAHAPALRTLRLARLPLAVWPLPAAPPHYLPALQHLSLAGCTKLEVAPPSPFASVAATLLSLDLSGVPAASRLPPGSLSVLTKLDSLTMRGVGLAQFPTDVLALAATLRVLDLTDNHIPELPPEIGGFKRLDELHLANNDLRALPPSLGRLSASLRAVTVAGNPLRSIRRAILDGGSARLLQYLRDRLPPEDCI